MEGSDLSIRLHPEPTAPVSGTPPLSDQSPPGDSGGKPRRRPPPPEEPAEAEPEAEDEDRPQHRIDNLA